MAQAWSEDSHATNEGRTDMNAGTATWLQQCEPLHEGGRGWGVRHLEASPGPCRAPCGSPCLCFCSCGCGVGELSEGRIAWGPPSRGPCSLPSAWQ